MSELHPDEPYIKAAGADLGRHKTAAQVARGALQSTRGATAPDKLEPTKHVSCVLADAICAFALFVDDDELRRRMNPKMGRDRFQAAVRAAELRGFPKIHPLWRGRYWPAVQAWLDSENGTGKNGFGFTAEDGPEDFNAPAR